MPELIKTRHSKLPINIMFEEFQAPEELQTIAQKQVQKRRKIRKLKMEEWISIQKKMRWQQDPSQGASCPGGRTPHGDPTTLIFFFCIDTLYSLGKIMKKKAQKFPSLSNLSWILSRFIFSLFYFYTSFETQKFQPPFLSFFILQNPQVNLQSSFQSQGSVAITLAPSPFNFYDVNTL